MIRKLKLRQLIDKMQGIDLFTVFDRNGRVIKKNATGGERELLNETVYRMTFITKEERRHDMNGHPVFHQLINCNIYLDKEIQKDEI